MLFGGRGSRDVPQLGLVPSDPPKKKRARIARLSLQYLVEDLADRLNAGELDHVHQPRERNAAAEGSLDLICESLLFVNRAGFFAETITRGGDWPQLFVHL